MSRRPRPAFDLILFVFIGVLCAWNAADASTWDGLRVAFALFVPLYGWLSIQALRAWLEQRREDKLCPMCRGRGWGWDAKNTRSENPFDQYEQVPCFWCGGEGTRESFDRAYGA